MFNNKPVISYYRPWYRNPIFPWGWYSVMDDLLVMVSETEITEIQVDGYFKPNDGEKSTYVYNPSYYKYRINNE